MRKESDGWKFKTELIPYEGTEKHELILMLVQAEDEIDDLRARIAELERCVVLGGDGKPIVIGQMIWFYSEVWKDWCRVAVFSIKRDGSDIVINDPIGKLKPEDCFSEVPEGDKE